MNIGDAVIVPRDFCPGCMDWIPELTTGLITGTEATSLLENDGLAGPFFTVYVDHPHNGDGHLVYAASELGGHQ